MRALLAWWENRKRAKTARYRWINGRYLTPEEEADVIRRGVVRG